MSGEAAAWRNVLSIRGITRILFVELLLTRLSKGDQKARCAYCVLEHE